MGAVSADARGWAYPACGGWGWLIDAERVPVPRAPSQKNQTAPRAAGLCGIQQRRVIDDNWTAPRREVWDFESGARRGPEEEDE